MPFLNRLINLYSRKRFRDIAFFAKHPLLAQQKILRRLVDRAAKTEWGREHAFLAIKSIEDFQKKVPISSYDDLSPFVSRMMQGEKDVLWPGKIKWFAKTSGTTAGRSKFIPVSKQGLKDTYIKGGKDVLFNYLRIVPKSRVLSGRFIAVAGFLDDYWQNRGVEVGDISAILLRRLPPLIRIMIGNGVETKLIKNWEERVEQIAHLASKINVTTLAGVPAWMSFLLKKFLDIEGKKNILDLWPNFELLVHGGVSLKPYRKIFDELVPRPPIHYLEIYNASEGFFAMQDDFSREDMMLMLDYGIFYEFLPRNEVGSPTAKPVTVDKVKKGVNYAIIITTSSGLWRYMIGDTVEFTSLFPHRLKITGRVRHFINTFGEELIVENAEAALALASEETGGVLHEFTAAPKIFSNNQGAHEWAIEFLKEPADKEEFVKIFDEHLRAINSDYDNKRHKDLLIKMPIVHFVPKGTFHKWLESKGKVGGQNKVPRLSQDRQHLEEILSLVS
jgi:hypothetical protein